MPGRKGYLALDKRGQGVLQITIAEFRGDGSSHPRRAAPAELSPPRTIFLPPSFECRGDVDGRNHRGLILVVQNY